MKKTKMNATKLRSLLSFLIILLIGLSGIGFYFAHDWLQTYADTVAQTIARSTDSGTTVTSLKKLQQDVVDRQDILTKANDILANPQDQQNQTIRDLDTYASRAGIAISNYSFVPPAATAATPGTTLSGAHSASVTLTLSSPISYTKLLTFMGALESNLPKMQVSSINLGRVVGSGSDSVKTDALTVEVYTQ